ncbi:hypothetical protein NE236_34755 [Actinoallomurus purpureus]|uniref:hypothetical protein n=1 Tax=Actinoallomurus purpureus TaxID=478114 RepID=UPI00209242C6|nr:hypothetical protein [Actinoallomurus purpureus]MCO6010140.1 hypothetical protein [Actinoallomurus purpureus]
MRDKNLRRMRIAVVTGAVAAGSIAAAAPAMAGTTTATPACKAANLTVRLTHIDAGAGQRYATLDFTTKKTCVLRNNLKGFTYAVPGKKGKTRNVSVHTYRDTGYSAKQAVVLKPSKHGKGGTVGHLVVHWSAVADKQIAPKALKFNLPAAGGRATVTWKQLVDGDLRLGIGALSLHR